MSKKDFFCVYDHESEIQQFVTNKSSRLTGTQKKEDSKPVSLEKPFNLKKTNSTGYSKKRELLDSPKKKLKPIKMSTE
jgi:hypothetical protein